MPFTNVVGLICDPSAASGAGASPAVSTVAVGSAAFTAVYAFFSNAVYAAGLGGFHDHDWFGSFQISHVVTPWARYRLTRTETKFANVCGSAGPAAPTAPIALAHAGVYAGRPMIERPR